MKFYAVVNRQGTKIRIKESHRLLSDYLENNSLPDLDENTPNQAVFVTKKDWLRICNELKIGYKESFIKLVNEKNSGGIILGCEEMKKEIINAQKFFGMKKDLEDEKQDRGATV